LTTGIVRVRSFRPSDRDACLALFDANAPQYFGHNERQEFAAFLDGLPPTFLVAERDLSGLLACGGIEIYPDRGEAEFRWVMVAPSAQKRGLGRVLMLLGARHLVERTAIRSILAYTTPQSAAFFGRLGFPTEIVRDELDYWTEGLDLRLLKIQLPRDARDVIAEQLERYPHLRV
jgi:GNAT superfamily N-acetyltransferase